MIGCPHGSGRAIGGWFLGGLEIAAGDRFIKHSGAGRSEPQRPPSLHLYITEEEQRSFNLIVAGSIVGSNEYRPGCQSFWGL